MKMVMILLVGLFAVDAFANNLFIPNYYRNRRTINLMSAIGWSDRNEASVLLYADKTTTDTAGTPTNETNGHNSTLAVFRRLNDQINLETALLGGNTTSEDMNPSAPERKTTAFTGSVGLGYEFADAPVAFGISFLNLRANSESGLGVKDHATHRFASAGVGYRLPSEIYIGTGLVTSWLDVSDEREPTFNYLAGAGKVFGDRKNPDAAAEASLQFQNNEHTQAYELKFAGLMNQESAQYYGSFAYELRDGTRSGDEVTLVAGMDYRLESNFYFGPQFAIGFDSADYSAGSDTKSSYLSLAAGYRVEAFEVVVRLGRDAEISERSSPSSDEEEDSREVAIGGSYFF